MSRGDDRNGVTVSIVNGRANWSAPPGADEHIVEIFDATGMPASSTTVATNAFDTPAGGGWIRIESRRSGQRLSRSPVVALIAP